MKRTDYFFVTAGLVVMCLISIIINLRFTPSFALPSVQYVAKSTQDTTSVDYSSSQDAFSEAEIEEHETMANRALADNKYELADNNEVKADVPKKDPPDFPININEASFDDLLFIPGIGKVTAEKIIAFRQLNEGNLQQISQLTAIKGIAEKTVEKLEEYLYCA